MTFKVLLITDPDDTQEHGLRILTVDLTPEQMQVISDALNQIDIDIPIIFYIWNTTNPIEWFLDKKQKSSLTFFNADSNNDLITGYVSASYKSHYFGNLKSLHIANKNAIYNVDQCVNILTDEIIKYER